MRDVERASNAGQLKEVKVYRIFHAPEDTEFSDFWIEDVGTSNNVTKKLLAQFVHDPVNIKRKKMIMWATEEIIRRGTGR